ncbi:MAG: hypothetical protein LLG01_02815 [Planctomycetaceae bacterium]|nr:hypothetical protein [Planctomycetaceae bacterium]
MSTLQVYKPASRGCMLRPPIMRVYHARVVAGGAPQWRREQVRPYWTPLHLHWQADGQPAQLDVSVVLGHSAQKPRRRPEDDHCCPGDRIRLVQVLAGSGGSGIEIEWFCGVVTGQTLAVGSGPDVESLTLTAQGPELLLSQKIITGQWWPTAELDALEMQGDLTLAQASRDGVWEARLPVVLNGGGLGNASGSDWRLSNGPSEANKCKVFAAPSRTAGSARSVHWTPYSALRSVVEWVDGGAIISSAATNWTAIEALLGQAPLGTLDLTGMNLVQAMRAILDPLGYGFAVEPWRADRQGHRLLVFPRSDPARQAQVCMAAAAGGVSIASAQGQRSQVQAMRIVRDAQHVRNRIIAAGDIKRTQRTLTFHHEPATRDLHPFWDAAAHDLASYARDNVIGPNNMAGTSSLVTWQQRYSGADEQYRHVFRTFVWNEDGGLSEIVADDEGAARMPDLASLGRDGKFARRPRPIGPRFEFADSGSQNQSAFAAAGGAFKAPLVELGLARHAGGLYVEDADAWIALPPRQATVRPDRAGVSIIVPDLLAWRPWMANRKISGGQSLHYRYGHLNYATLLHNAMRAADDGSMMLRLRVTGSVEMDDCVSHEAARSSESAWPFDSAAMLRAGERFKYRSVGDTVSASLPATVDDSPALQALAQRARVAAQDALTHGSVTLRGLQRAYSPGMALARLQGRNIELSARRAVNGAGECGVPAIVAVRWDFQNGAGKTELNVDSR